MEKAAKGYTLIELMIVVAIIGVLASILIPNLARARYQAKLSVCEQNERGLASSLLLYSTDNEYLFPAALSGTVPVYANSLPSCPTNPASNYNYTSSLNHSEYTISCTGSHIELLGPNGGPAGAPHLPQYSAWGGLIMQ